MQIIAPHAQAMILIAFLKAEQCYNFEAQHNHRGTDMESIFITKIFALTEEILRGDYVFEPTRDALQNHLAKAQKMGSVRYEAEALNTFGILHLLAGNSAENIHYFL